MTRLSLSISSFVCGGLVVAACTATTSPGGSTDGGGADGPASSSGGQALRWYSTCGDPVCMTPTADAGPLTDDAGVPCPAAGSACSVDGQSCGTSNPSVNCGATEVCASQDPTMSRGGCPISSRSFKDDIEYVNAEGLKELHDETLGMRLATYRYKDQYADPRPAHLGFIIEDAPPASPAVQWSRDRVDMYGYLSMVVATVEVQEKEIEALRRELAESRGGACP